MTIPIARVVATRYADVEPPLRLCYLQRAYRAVRPQRGEAREQLQAGIELVGAPDAGRDRRGDRRCAPRAGRRRAAGLPDRARERRRCTRRCSTRPASPGRRASGCCTSSSRATSSAWPARWRRPGRRRAAADASRSCAAARRSSTPRGRPPTACARCTACCPADVQDARDLRPRPAARPRLLHGRDLRGASTPRSASRSAAAGATTSCSGASGGRCRRSAGRSRSSGCTSALSRSARR